MLVVVTALAQSPQLHFCRTGVSREDDRPKVLSHSGEVDDNDVLGCDAMYTLIFVPVFRRNILSPASEGHGFTTQNNIANMTENVFASSVRQYQCHRIEQSCF